MTDVEIVDGHLNGHRSILVFDRAADTRCALTAVLAEAGYTVNAYPLDELPVDDGAALIITGLPGPSYDDRAAVLWVRRMRRRYRTPVIVISTQLSPQDPQLAAMAAAVVLAPVDVGTLSGVVRSLFV